MALSVGMWIWNLNRCEGGNVARIIDRCRTYRIGHVLVKIKDGTSDYNGPSLRLVFDALRAAGVNAWAWGYFRPDKAETQALMFASRSLALGATGVSVDAEVEFKGRPAEAVRFMDTLRHEWQRPIAVSSYYLPWNHPTFPWREFYSRADFAMPQVYFYGTPPATALSQSLIQHASYMPVWKTIPVGAAYPEATGAPGNITRFLESCVRQSIVQCNFWSWEHCTPEMWTQLARWNDLNKEIA